MTRIQPRGWVDKAVEIARSAYDSNVLHLALSLAFLQGAPFLGQFFSARLLGPADFGRVRVIETTLAILLIPAGIGMSSAIVRFAALARASGDSSAYLRGALQVASLAGLLTAALASIAVTLAVNDPVLRAALLVLVWSLPFTNTSRIIVNYMLAEEQIRRVAWLNVVTSGAGLALTITGAWAAAMNGWLSGRFLGEVVTMAALVWLMFIPQRAVCTTSLSRDKLGRFVSFGFFMALGTGVDRLASTADTLYLQTFVGDPFVIGQYGAASLVVQGVGLLPAAAMATALPRLAARAQDPELVIGFLRQHAPAYLGVLGILSLFVCFPGPQLLVLFLGPEYEPASRLLAPLAPSMLMMGVLQGGGALLFAFGRGDLALWQSVLGLVLNLSLNALLLPWLGTMGAVLALLGSYLGRIVCMAFLVVSATATARRHHA